MQWRYDLSRAGKDLDRPDPFADAKDGDAPPRRNRPNEVLSGFQLVKGHVFCLRGQGELIALDGDTGAVDWSFSAPSGQINPNFWSVPIGRCSRSTSPTSCWCSGPTTASRRHARPSPRMSVSSAFPCPSMKIRSCWSPISGRSRNSTSIMARPSGFIRRAPCFRSTAPPRLFGDCERLLVLHDGRLLIRLDPATGSKRWSCLLGRARPERAARCDGLR